MRLFVEENGQNNLRFPVLLQLDSTTCVDLLTKTQRGHEAFLFARTCAPRYVFISHIYIHFFYLSPPYHVILFSQASSSKAVQAWDSDLQNSPPKRETRLQLSSLMLLRTVNFEEGWEEVLARGNSCCIRFGNYLIAYHRRVSLRSMSLPHSELRTIQNPVLRPSFQG